MDARSFRTRLQETIQVYAPLGWTSFGGPTAHIGIFHQLFIDKLHWLSEETFAQFFGIAQALPGPASTQMAFVIAMYRNGIPAAIVSFLLWSIPGFLMMTSLAIAMSFIPAHPPSWVLYLHNGLASVAIGLSALAGYRLTMKVVNDPVESMLCWATAMAAIVYQAQWWPPFLILFGACAAASVHGYKMWRQRRNYQHLNDDQERATMTTGGSGSNEPLMTATEKQPVSTTSNNGVQPTADYHASYFCTLKQGVAILVAMTVILIACFIIWETLPKNGQFLALQIFCAFFITGTIIFGGGPIVVPLLYNYVVTPGWMTDQEFTMGLAVISVMPGPNFNFSAYCGGLALHNWASRTTDSTAVQVFYIIIGALIAYVGIFLPGLAVKAGILPLWKHLQNYPIVNVVLKGVSAAAIGLVWSAVYILAKTAVITSNDVCANTGILGEPLYVAIALSTIAASTRFKLQPVLVILLGAGAAMLLYAIRQ